VANINDGQGLVDRLYKRLGDGMYNIAHQLINVKDIAQFMLMEQKNRMLLNKEATSSATK